jgi:hypothetical protein
MCGYLIVVKTIAKIRPSCKCYMNSQKLNMYMLIVYIIHSAFGDVMLNHNLQLNVRCNFNYVIKANLVVNINYKCFIVAN